MWASYDVRRRESFITGQNIIKNYWDLIILQLQSFPETTDTTHIVQIRFVFGYLVLKKCADVSLAVKQH